MTTKEWLIFTVFCFICAYVVFELFPLNLHFGGRELLIVFVIVNLIIGAFFVWNSLVSRLPVRATKNIGVENYEVSKIKESAELLAVYSVPNVMHTGLLVGVLTACLVLVLPLIGFVLLGAFAAFSQLSVSNIAIMFCLLGLLFFLVTILVVRIRWAYIDMRLAKKTLGHELIIADSGIYCAQAVIEGPISGSMRSNGLAYKHIPWSIIQGFELKPSKGFGRRWSPPYWSIKLQEESSPIFVNRMLLKGIEAELLDLIRPNLSCAIVHTDSRIY